MFAVSMALTSLLAHLLVVAKTELCGHITSGDTHRQLCHFNAILCMRPIPCTKMRLLGLHSVLGLFRVLYEISTGLINKKSKPYSFRTPLNPEDL